MLPGIDIQFDNGNIGTVVPTADGVLGLLASAVAVVDTFELNKPYQLKGMSDVAALGILPDVNNYWLHKALSSFYEEAGEGTKLWLMGFAKDTKVSDWFTPVAETGKVPASKILDAANGEIVGLFSKFAPNGDYTLTLQDGIDADVSLAKQKAQLLAENYTSKSYAPFFTLIEGYGFNGTHTALPSLSQESNNRVGVVLGSVYKRTGEVPCLGAATEVVAGRIAATQVHESTGKVKRGALKTLNAYMLDDNIEEYDVEGVHDKGFITFRTHVRKSGYYVADDPLATNPSNDDYHNVPLRRTIDKAYRLAHSIASEEILADFDLTNTGTIDPMYAKDIEGRIEREIQLQMTSRGELSASKTDKNDQGVKASFDLKSNVVQTRKIQLTLHVRPKGYARFFEIKLGYNVELNN